ncbi:L-serine ammonia-lyase [Thelephora terrestris]|uniref:L-serine ammonia-lyase n=1 Tax=Thelephora terrestris TaxID=56493 RepID=A0A9P6HG31_9AGAM|nr:L-serine ammonia-lyase [Thelephora terrestris]
MLPAIRRVTSGSLTTVRKAQGLQVAQVAFGSRTGFDGKNVTAVQRSEGGSRHARTISHTAPSRSSLNSVLQQKEEGGIIKGEGKKEGPLGQPEHAVISTFDLFSIGVGPSSSHTVGPMRAGNIFINDLKDLGMLERVRITSYGSLAATGKGHHTPQAILLGLEGSDPETIEAGTIPARYQAMLDTKSIMLGGHHTIHYDHNRDMIWRYDQVLPAHPNGMRFSVFDEGGDMLATNEYFSVGGGFVVNEKTKTAGENMFYKGVDKRAVHSARLSQSSSGTDATDGEKDADPSHPPYPFKNGETLLALSRRHNMTIAQIVYDNELSFGYTDEEIHDKLLRIWAVMDDCIRTGVSTSEKTLPGRLGLHRRAPMLYRRLMRGFYPALAPSFSGYQRISEGERASGEIDSPDGFDGQPYNGNVAGVKGGPTKRESPVRRPAARVVGQFDHPLLPVPPRKTTIPAVDFLSCYAIAVNEVNAAGGRIVTSPTNGASGVIPSVLKYIIEFVSDDPQKSITTFLLTAAAVGMLFKRGSTISAAEGGCQAEVGVACSMAAAGFAACMGAPPETVLQAAEIGIEHNLGLTCDPIDGLVQVPCIERNSLGAVKAVTAAQLAMASDTVYRVSLDQAIEAMRLTAADMSVKYKETSLSGLATTVKIPLTVPTW